MQNSFHPERFVFSDSGFSAPMVVESSVRNQSFWCRGRNFIGQADGRQRTGMDFKSIRSQELQDLKSHETNPFEDCQFLHIFPIFFSVGRDVSQLKDTFNSCPGVSIDKLERMREKHQTSFIGGVQ